MASEEQRAIEAILMVAEQPIEPGLLAQLLEIPTARVEELCAELAAAYEEQERGFVLARVAGGYRYQSHPDLAPYIERFVLDGQHARLSNAALETLAIVAYKQPVSRAQVAAIRGVNVDGVMRTLQQRGYIDEVGRDPGPGQASLYGTTDTFLEKLGLDSLDDLPPLSEFVPGAEVVEALEQGLRADPVADVPENLSRDPRLRRAGESADAADVDLDLTDAEGATDDAVPAPPAEPQGFDEPEGLDEPEGFDVPEAPGPAGEDAAGEPGTGGGAL